MSEATGKERGKRGPRQVREGRWEDEDADEDEDESDKTPLQPVDPVSH